jgi:hypothetical protein
MLIAFMPLLFAILGILIMALSKNPVVVEIGKWIFIIGFFFFTWSLAGRTVKLL